MQLIVVLDPQGGAQVDPGSSRLNLQPAWQMQGQSGSLSSPADKAAARRILGRPPRPDEDGRLPLTAWSCGEPGAWATLTPCHGLVGSDRITGLPPSALLLHESESRALFDAVEPLFASEGVELRWHSPLAWRLRHESLRSLPCASVDRMVGDSMQRWQATTPLASSRLLRRLQNEAQMVLHGHPVNEARSARGGLAVNSLWLWGAGAADQIPDGPSAQAAAASWRHIRRVDLGDLTISGDTGKGIPNVESSDASTFELVLCGRSGAQAFALAKPGAVRRTSQWWTMLKQSFLGVPRTETGSSIEASNLKGWIAHWRTLHGAELDEEAADSPHAHQGAQA